MEFYARTLGRTLFKRVSGFVRLVGHTQLIVNPMRMITGAILLLAAVQAFSHAYLIGFPHQAFAGEILVPGSVVLVALGVCFLVWALIVERKH